LGSLDRMPPDDVDGVNDDDGSYDADDIDSDEPSGEERPPRSSWLASIITPKSAGHLTDPELRRKMRTLDPQERRIAFFAAPIALALSLINYLPLVLHNTTTYQSEPFTGPKSDPHCAYTLADKGKVCELMILHHPGDYILEFIAALVVCSVLLYATWRSKRTLAIFSTLLIGLFSGIVGLLFLLYGGWLVLRSWRLQRYGAKDAATARKVSIEQTAERREQRRNRPERTSGGAPSVRPEIKPSKRYTPKAKRRRR
jgi:hypothetical protein